MPVTNAKTVLILGAGFSVSGNIPTQNNLLKEIVNWSKLDGTTALQKETWKNFQTFFKRSLGKVLKNYYVEDIFTIFDIAQINKEGFRSNTFEQVQSASNSLLSSIRSYLMYAVESNFVIKNDCYNDLAIKLLRKRHSFDKNDKMSIISLNWDNYFDKILTYKISSHQAQLNNIGLDYCTYDYSFSNNLTIPSILKKAAGKINFKLLKPHGSINWGYCSNCNRLYISYGKKIQSKFECVKYCNKRFKKNRIDLSPILITPTFLKDLGNLHLKNIWSNAGIEISEANKLIFIGYSLRPEDFYFRQLLAKNYRSDSQIFVYDYCQDSNQYSEKEMEIKSKFMQFFQKTKKVEVKVNGWENNIDDIVSKFI